MKKIQIITGVSLVLFFVTVTSLLGASFFVKFDSNFETLKKESDRSNSKFGSSVSDKYLTVEDVLAHATVKDCWMIISGSVYDFTNFLSLHPGSAASMLPYCGKDGTQAFATKDRNPGDRHSKMAEDMMKEYFLGVLGQPVKNNENPILETGTVIPTKIVSGNNLTITASETGRHNNLGDCWMIITGKVYNVTSYIVLHPGGAEAILKYCGKDGTQAFTTKDLNPGSGHSSLAQNILNSFLIGSLGQTVVINANSMKYSPTVVVTIAPTAQPTLALVNVSLTTSEVGRHNNLADCWLIISNKIYNVTSYIVRHPGGASAITNMCGKEATNAFQTKGGGGGNHSSSAYNLLGSYYIGDLNSSVVVNPTGVGATATPGSGSNFSQLPTAITDKYPGATKKSGKYEDDGVWEGKINTASGQCREIKVNSSGNITSDSSC